MGSKREVATEKLKSLEREVAARAGKARVSRDEMMSQVLKEGLDAIDARERASYTGFDLLLVVATETEFRALENEAIRRGLTFQKSRGTTAEYFSLGTLGDQSVGALRLGEMGSFSEQGSAFTTWRAIIETGAAAVIAVGTAFGVSEEQQKLGDVLIARRLFLYDECDVWDGTDSYRIEYGPRAVIDVPKQMVDQFVRAAVRQESADVAPNVHIGTILCGGARIRSAAFRNDVVRRVPHNPEAPVVGGEMEAPGVAAASEASECGWIVVKGISDFASAESRASIKEYRSIAAANAAGFVLDAIARASLNDE